MYNKISRLWGRGWVTIMLIVNQLQEETHNLQNSQYKLIHFTTLNKLSIALFPSSRNTQVFQATRLMQDRIGLNAAPDFLENDMDILEYAQRHRSDSSWCVEMETNVLVNVYPNLSAPVVKRE